MNRRGFTLIEVLVTLALMAIFITLVQGVYSGVVRSKRAATKATVAAHAASAVINYLSDELGQAFQSRTTVPYRIEETFFFLSTAGDRNSTLTFTTHTVNIPTVRQGGDVRVTYEVVKDDDHEGLFALRRSEMADLLGDPGRDATEWEMLDSLSRFTVECYSEDGGWQDYWDHVTGSAPVIPIAARITIGWKDSADSESEHLITTATPIYSAAGRNK